MLIVRVGRRRVRVGQRPRFPDVVQLTQDRDEQQHQEEERREQERRVDPSLLADEVHEVALLSPVKNHLKILKKYSHQIHHLQ